MENKTKSIKPASKTLSDYIQAKQSVVMDKAGAIFAFSNEQFEKAKKEGVTYVRVLSGMLCPKDTVKELVEGLTSLHTEGIAQDTKDHGKDSIILRELLNHEAFYTWEIEDTVEALVDYDLTEADVQRVFDATKFKYSD